MYDSCLAPGKGTHQPAYMGFNLTENGETGLGLLSHEIIAPRLVDQVGRSYKSFPILLSAQ